MPKSRTILARLSIFDRDFQPVKDAPKFLKACRKRFGKPEVKRRLLTHIYRFDIGIGLDYISILINR